ncbi:MAG TPA: nucleotide sugar dehydrogenase [Candidatus Saccharimonadales bacterium]|nr:nucleotide sugar dehydrogenase [Candidatus Saccharimonadales bacterium]
MQDSTLTVLGAGYVGLTTAALLAHAGYTVYVVEPNPKRLDVIRQGRSFFFEEGLDPVIKAAIDNGTLIPTDSYEDGVPKSRVVFSCVGTPDNPDGSSNLTYVHSAAKEAAKYLHDGAIYVQKSTVPVGTGRAIEETFKQLDKKIEYVSNPEFLREGTALFDTLCFDRVVVGGRHKPAVEHVLNIYRQLETYRGEIAALAGIELKDVQGSYIATNLNSAELIKVTSNAFLALKISFANSIAKLADQVDADVVEVMDAVGADARIGRAFLNAGRGYGGGCFPKDVSGLIMSGLEHGVDLEIMTAAQELNSSMPGYIVEKLRDALGGDLAGKKVAVLGLAFKAGTSDVRRSPGVLMANVVTKSGATTTAYDPQAAEEAAEELHSSVRQTESIESALAGSDAVIIATDWPEFIGYEAEKYKQHMAGTIFIDAVNRFVPAHVSQAGLNYIGVGR